MRDPFHVPESIIPQGMSYQWVALTICGDPSPHFDRMKNAGWSPVPGSRHPDQWHTYGDIVVKGQMLMERPMSLTVAAHDANLAAVAKQMDDWAARAGASDLSGGVRMQMQGEASLSRVYERPVGDRLLAAEILRLTNGVPQEFLQRFRDVWHMPYVVLPSEGI